MRSQCIDSEEDYRKKLVEYYIAMSPWGSWNFVAGELLYSKQHRALEKVKGNVKVDKGTIKVYNYVGDTYVLIEERILLM